MMHTEVNGVECPGRNQNEKPKGPRTCLWGRADALKGGGDRGEELTREAAAPGGQSREPRAESRSRRGCGESSRPGSVVLFISACAEDKPHRLRREERLLSLLTYGGDRGQTAGGYGGRGW